jgi:hypothetical protein
MELLKRKCAINGPSNETIQERSSEKEARRKREGRAKEARRKGEGREKEGRGKGEERERKGRGKGEEREKEAFEKKIESRLLDSIALHRVLFPIQA